VCLCHARLDRIALRGKAFCVTARCAGHIGSKARNEVELHRLGSDAGGDSAGVIYPLLGTGKLSGINSQHYRRHVLERIADHAINRADELLHWVVAHRIADDTQ
jgi:hypothetical protein